MIKLEDLKAGMRVCGLVPDQISTLISVKGRGFPGSDSFATVVRYEDEYDEMSKQTLDRSVEARLIEAEDNWVIGSQADLGVLAIKARRIRDAHLYDSYHEAFSAEIEPLPHQTSAVYGWMLGRYPLRVLLADDPGAGKTIMAGLLICQMIARDLVHRCLIVVPGNLTEQWKTELRDKLRLRFDIVERGDIADDNPFISRNQLIISMDRAKREEYLDKLKQSEWDLVVCDEAHKMSVSYIGNKLGNVTSRYRLGLQLGDIATNYLLLTATPHSGKSEEFRSFMRLLDRDRFSHYRPKINVSDLYLRRMKEQLVTRDMKPLFPKRVTYTAKYDISPPELDLYEAVTEYCRHEFNRAAHLEGGRRNTVGFALTILQRRLASSPEAIYQSLRSRRERLTAKIEESRAMAFQIDEIDWEEFEDMPAQEREKIETDIVNLATAAQSIPELEKEISTLANLEAQADSLRRSNRDSKWEELRDIWENRLPEMEHDGMPRKLIIFSEHRATLGYLVRKLGVLLGDEANVVTIHGGINPVQRRSIQHDFQHDPNVQVLVATDAAGEGINLQFAHLMVNYDLPWNPNRLEQRFGRIHRIGQKEVCHLFNLVIGNTREDAVYRLLAEKLEVIGNALDGLVFDILGELFYQTPLPRLVRDSLQFGDDPERRREIERQVESAFDLEHIKELELRRISERSAFDADRAIHDMREADAGGLQTRDAKDFLIGTINYIENVSLSRVSGIRDLGAGQFELERVPGVIAEFAETHNIDGVKSSYRSVCFDRDLMRQSEGNMGAEFIHREHPLLKAAIGWVLSRWQSVRAECGDAFPILIDERTDSTSVRIVYQLEWSIQNDLQRERGVRHALSDEAQFVQLDHLDSAQRFTMLGTAPDVDYRPATVADMNTLKTLLEHEMFAPEHSAESIEEQVYESLIAPKLDATKTRELKRIAIERTEVINSLDARITHEQERSTYFRRLADQLPENDPARNLHHANEARHSNNRRLLEARKMHRERQWRLQEHITPSVGTPRRVAVIVPASLMR